MALWEHLPPVRLEGSSHWSPGRAGGLGRDIALALSEAGSAVAVCARAEDDRTRVAAEIADRHGRALAIRCDVTHRQEVEGIVAAVEEALGPVIS